MRSERLEFDNEDGLKLSARLELPDGDPRAVALFAHCFTCSKDIAAAGRISRALSLRGVATLRFDFTGLGNSEGDFANTNFQSNTRDLIAAADALRDRLEAPQILIGHSLGGAAVLASAAEIPEVKAVATIGAPSDPSHVTHLIADDLERIEKEGCAIVELGGRKFEIRRQFLEALEETSLKERIRTLDRALLVFHSPTDNTVGIDEARKIYEAARHPKSFVSLTGADHLLSQAEDSEYVAEVLAAWAGRFVSGWQDPAVLTPSDEQVVAAGHARTQQPMPHGTVLVEEQDGFQQRVVMGEFLSIADEPESVGGKNSGPTPYDLLLASLGTCTSMTLRMYANHKGLTIDHISVELTHDRIHAKDCRDCETSTGRVDRIVRKLKVEGDLTAEQRARLLEIADRCPVHKTLVGEKQIETEWAN